MQPINCSKCHAKLTQSSYEGAVISSCSTCGYDIVSKPALRHIIRQRDKVFDPYDSVAESKQTPIGVPAHHMESSRTCSGCQAELPAKYFAVQSTIVIQECDDCQLVYFDHDELERIQKYVEGTERLNNGEA